MIGGGLWTAQGVDQIVGYSPDGKTFLSPIPVQRYGSAFSVRALHESVAPREARKRIKEADLRMATAELAV